MAEILIPREYLDELGWKDGNILDFEVIDSCIKVTKKVNWNVEDAQENIDRILDDIVKNGTIHFIEHQGKNYVMAPYSEELENLKKEVKNG
jgi:bifunctional DNA-binding transcriptional regulator/antitoxin component of YhaV-PrlF toxin-antitoxin module